jgi:hypothetical protein
MPTLRTGDCGGFDHKDTILEADRIAFAIVAGGKVTANGGVREFYLDGANCAGIAAIVLRADFGGTSSRNRASIFLINLRLNI